MSEAVSNRNFDTASLVHSTITLPVCQTVTLDIKQIPGTSPSLRSARTPLPYRAPQGCCDTFLRTTFAVTHTLTTSLRRMVQSTG